MDTLLNLIKSCKYCSETPEYIKQIEDTLTTNINHITEDQQTELLIRAIRRKLYTTVKLFLDNNFNVNIRSMIYGIPIEIAATYGDNKMIEMLILYGAILNPVNHNRILRYDYYTTPLICAAINFKYDTVKLLLQFGANPNYININCFYQCLITTTVSSNYRDDKPLKFKIIKLLIKYGANLNTNNCELINSVTKFLPECLPYLIRHGLDLNKTFYANKYTVLQYVVEQSEERDVVQDLKTLLHLGANPNIKNQNGFTPEDLIEKFDVISQEREEILNILRSYHVSLQTLTLKMILIHEIDTTSVPKSVLKY